MPLNHSLIGVQGEPQERSWTSADALLYAIGVGAGLGDPLQELQFTTENTAGVQQQVLPTYGVLLAQARAAGDLGDFDRAGEPVVTTRGSTFIRGEGGFGGDRGTSEPWQLPDRAPDHKVTQLTRPEQALLYRLSGDRNPLHADPAFAARGGFSRPILHGLCTYGMTGRVLLHEVCGSDPARFISMSGRFSRPVLPGESLVISIWAGDDRTAQFQTATEDGTVVIDRGVVRYR
jgi:acyl dehydratase